MTQEKDYSLLRPFDLEAAKRGEAICGNEGATYEYVGGPDHRRYVCAKELGDVLFLVHINHLRMAPLAWVEGRPVYQGDVLDRVDSGAATATADGMRYDGLTTIPWGVFNPEFWKWPKTKAKREVKLLAHLDADQLFWLRETAMPKWPAVRVPSEDKVIEVEEPAC